MDKKKLIKKVPPEDLRGFEDFIEGSSEDTHFLPRGVGGGSTKREASFEHYTFLTNDSTRLLKLKKLLGEKLPFTARHSQGERLLTAQVKDIQMLKDKIFQEANSPTSGFRRSLSEIFDSFFGPTKS